jgi:hypothetical protein
LFYWIYDYPSWAIGALFALAFIAMTWAAIFVFRRFCHSWFHREKRSNEMVGFVLSAYAVLYGILLGLIAVGAYQNFSDVDSIVSKEAATLGSLYHDIREYPQPERAILQNDLKLYTYYIINDGWVQQRKGVVPTAGTHRVNKFIDDLLAFQPSSRSEEILHTEVLHQLNIYLDLRHARLSSVTKGIPEVLWFVVAAGAIIFVLLVAMLDMEVHVHLILSTALAAFLGLVIFLMAAMDNPFRGEVSIGPEAFEEIYAALMVPNDAVDRSMAELIAITGRMGPPRLSGQVTVADKTVPGLYFGNTAVSKDFDVVDQVVQRTGGTASLFVKSGDDFVRVTTNVKKSDGSRAIGTILDPKGPVIVNIRRGEPYYGEAIILGRPYMTGYEPIRDSANQIIGIYYVGYKE